MLAWDCVTTSLTRLIIVRYSLVGHRYWAAGVTSMAVGSSDVMEDVGKSLTEETGPGRRPPTSGKKALQQTPYAQ